MRTDRTGSLVFMRCVSGLAIPTTACVCEINMGGAPINPLRLFDALRLKLCGLAPRIVVVTDTASASAYAIGHYVIRHPGEDVPSMFASPYGPLELHADPSLEEWSYFAVVDRNDLDRVYFITNYTSP